MTQALGWLIHGVFTLLFMGASAHYVFLWLDLTHAMRVPRLAFAVAGPFWMIVGTLAGFAAFDWLGDGDVIGEALLIMFYILFGMPLIALGVTSIASALLPNGALRRLVLVPLLLLTPISGLLTLERLS
jgi:hypothetical protein